MFFGSSGAPVLVPVANTRSCHTIVGIGACTMGYASMPVSTLLVQKWKKSSASLYMKGSVVRGYRHGGK
jgi:hypothetical protein